MDCRSFIISCLTILVPSLVSIFTIWNQFRINEDNNKRLLESEKLNNENQLKLKRLDYYYSEKGSAIFKYLDDLFNYFNNSSPENLLKYQSSMAKASMYTSGDAYDHICFINNCIERDNLDNAKKHLKLLMDALCVDSQQYK